MGLEHGWILCPQELPSGKPGWKKAFNVRGGFKRAFSKVASHVKASLFDTGQNGIGMVVIGWLSYPSCVLNGGAMLVPIGMLY